MGFTNISFIVAMESEAEPVVEAFNLEEDLSFHPEMPMRAWQGKVGSLHLSLVINGKDTDSGLDLIGTQAATLATRFAIEKYNPQLIVNAGTAGAFGKNGAKIGDVYLSCDHILFHDRRVPIAGWDKQSIGYYPVWEGVSDIASMGYKTGVVTTGNSLDMTEEDEKSILHLGGEIKEMEAAAVAWVAKLHQIPVFCIKAITDLMDSGNLTQDDFLKNLRLATSNLKDACVRIIHAL
jgi:5'-methylthioadenosine nucleosidase